MTRHRRPRTDLPGHGGLKSQTRHRKTLTKRNQSIVSSVRRRGPRKMGKLGVEKRFLINSESVALAGLWLRSGPCAKWPRAILETRFKRQLAR